MTSLRTCNARARRAARRAAGRPAPRTALAIAIRRRLNGCRFDLPAGAILTSSGCGLDPEIGEARRREIDDAIRARAPVIAFGSGQAHPVAIGGRRLPLAED